MIQVGDKVMIVGSHCLGGSKKIGEISVVEKLVQGPSTCNYCNGEDAKNETLALICVGGKSFLKKVSWLYKIPPDSQVREREKELIV